MKITEILADVNPFIKIVEIPNTFEKDERLFSLSEIEDPAKGRPPVFLMIHYSIPGQEYQGVTGLEIIGEGEDIQDPFDLLAHAIDVLETRRHKYDLNPPVLEKSHVSQCSRCNKIRHHRSDMTTGYGYDKDGNKICYSCCAIGDRERMTEDGRITLYLTFKTDQIKSTVNSQLRTVNYMTPSEITNWPGSLRFKILSWSRGDHNWNIPRYDVWFLGPDNKIWYGRHQGNNTQLIHCKRTKHTGYAGLVADRYIKDDPPVIRLERQSDKEQST